MIIYSKPGCPHCARARDLADKHGHNVIMVDITDRPDIATWLSGKGATTVPQVFIGGRHVGGYEDLRRELGDA